jgi:hypothetical protein
MKQLWGSVLPNVGRFQRGFSEPRKIFRIDAEPGINYSGVVTWVSAETRNDYAF